MLGVDRQPGCLSAQVTVVSTKATPRTLAPRYTVSAERASRSNGWSHRVRTTSEEPTLVEQTSADGIRARLDSTSVARVNNEPLECTRQLQQRTEHEATTTRDRKYIDAGSSTGQASCSDGWSHRVQSNLGRTCAAVTKRRVDGFTVRLGSTSVVRGIHKPLVHSTAPAADRVRRYHDIGCYALRASARYRERNCAGYPRAEIHNETPHLAGGWAKLSMQVQPWFKTHATVVNRRADGIAARLDFQPRSREGDS